MLVPEISLTPQLAARFRGRFGDRRRGAAQRAVRAARADAWRRIRRGEVDIALGARSAVFAPLADLGVVVVDEEHDGSFKQEEGVRYHGRDVALVRARAAGAVALLGSATPSLETFVAARERAARAARRCPSAPTARPLPTVEIVDLKQHKPATASLGAAAARRSPRRSPPASRRSCSSTGAASPRSSLCKACGHALRCRHCSVSLTYHRSDDS